MANRKITKKVRDEIMKKLVQNFGPGYDQKGLAEIQLEAFPTGHDDLDCLLTKGAMGVARGALVEIFGSEGGGKCLTRDTFCLTHKGLLSVEEIFADAGVQIDASQGFVEKTHTLVNGKGCFETTSHFYRNSQWSRTSKKTIRLTTKDGFTLEGTHNHPVLVMDTNGFIVWKKLKQIQKTDNVCIRRNTQVWNNANDSISSDEAALVGYLIGDGNFTPTCRIGFTNADARIVADFKRSLASAYGNDILDCVRQYDIEYHINRKTFVDEFKNKHRIGNELSCDKTMPYTIRTASREAQKCYIRAYFDADGTFQYDKINLQFSSCSLLLLQQLQLILLNFGIYAHITSTYNKEYDKDYYELEMAGIELDKYEKNIGFNKNDKCDKIRETLRLKSQRIYNTNIDTIPHQSLNLASLYGTIDPQQRSRETCRLFHDAQQGRCDLTYSRLKKILGMCLAEANNPLRALRASSEHNPTFSYLCDHFDNLMQQNYIYSSVIQIEEGFERTFDFTLPDTHSFWSNGLISHNSSLAMRVVGIAQKNGHECCWIDAEAAFSVDLARINGVSTEDLDMPDLFKTKATQNKDEGAFFNSSEILHMIYKSVQANIYGIIVLDSVAGLMPESVLADDSDPNKQNIAEVARSMAKHLGKIAQSCKKYDTTVIFINQLRDKPGDQYARNHTPGGRALKFFAHQRISVNKKGGVPGQVWVKEEDGTNTLIGHYARTKIIKNRMAPPVPPDLSIEIPIYYSEYNPDNAKQCYDLARKLQVITIRNSTLMWRDGKEEVLKKEGESEMLGAIREYLFDSRLAAACVAAAESEKNQKKKQPIRISTSIAELAKTYNKKEDEKEIF